MMQIDIEEMAEQLTSAANIVTNDGYYELDNDAVAQCLDKALATTRAELAALKERERETLAVLQTAHESEAALVRQKNALIHVVRWISANYENGEINHKDFRVRAKHLADDALLGDPV